MASKIRKFSPGKVPKERMEVYCNKFLSRLTPAQSVEISTAFTMCYGSCMSFPEVDKDVSFPVTMKAAHCTTIAYTLGRLGTRCVSLRYPAIPSVSSRDVFACKTYIRDKLGTRFAMLA